MLTVFFTCGPLDPNSDVPQLNIIANFMATFSK